MGQITITIDKREYAISCDDGQEAHILQLSRLLDEKAKMLSASVGLVNENMKLALVGLLLADELQELQEKSADNSEQKLVQIDAHVADAVEKQVQRIQSLIKDIKEV